MENTNDKIIQDELFAACKNGNLEAVQRILNSTLSSTVEEIVKARDNQHNTPLIWASICGHFEIVELLLSKGADINDQDEDGQSSLFYLSSAGKEEAILKLITSIKVDLNLKNKFGETALVIALKTGRLNIAELLISKGADVNVNDRNGDTALIIALKTRHLNITELLISKGADVNAKDINGETPLLYATYFKRIELVNLLISKGAELNLRNNKDENSLSIALMKGFDEIAELLIKYGATKSENELKQDLLLEKQKLEKELKIQKPKDEAKSLIEDIVKAATQEEPLLYFLIQNKVVRKENKSNIETIVGGALGGITGAMIGSAFSSTSTEYSGNIGILVVTKETIIVKYFKTNIYSPGCIHLTQLYQLLAEIKSQNSLIAQTFKINTSEIFKENIKSRFINFYFEKSMLYIDGSNIYELPQDIDFVKLCNDLGSLITVEEFVEKLTNKISPMNEIQFEVAIKNNKPYFYHVFYRIMESENKEDLVGNFIYLIPAIRKLLVAELQEVADKLKSKLISSILFFILSAALLIWFIVIFYDDDGAFVRGGLFIVLIITTIVSFSYLKSYYKARWCVRKISSGQMNNNDYLNAEPKIYIPVEKNSANKESDLEEHA